jgi:hypothetical protein
MESEQIYYLPFTRKGLELLLNAMDVAYINAPSKTDDELFAAAAQQRILKILNNPERQPNG